MIEDINLLMSITRGIIIAAVSLKVILTFLSCQTGVTTIPAAMIKARNVITAGIIASVLPSFLPYLANTYFASSDVSSMYHASNGPIMLINGLMTVILTMEPGIVIYYVMKEIIAYKLASEDYAKAEHISKVKMIIGVGIVIICCTGVINTILDYYK